MSTHILPGVYTKIVDLSTYVQAVPGTVGFLCALTESGEDNKLTFVSSRDELIQKFGKPNINKYGSNYGQGPYISYNYLGESGALYFMRCLPDDAEYANLRIDGLNYDSSTDIEISYVNDLNSTTDISTALQSVGIRTPLVIFYSVGRGGFYNKYGIELEADPNEVTGVYILNIYERQSDDQDVIIESYKISFDSDAKNTSGESIFVEYVLETYSNVLRAQVGTDGFNLLERVFDTEHSPVRCEDIDRRYYVDDILYIDTTAIIDTTSWVTVEVPVSATWATMATLNSTTAQQGGLGSTASGALSVAGYHNGALNYTEKYTINSWATTSNYPISIYDLSACGTTSNALAMGGYSTSFSNKTYIWNGSVWATTTNTLTTKAYRPGMVGTTSASIVQGGYGGSFRTNEKWDGAIWTYTTNPNNSRCAYAAFVGATDNAILCGGYTGGNVYYDVTETWDGSSWTTRSSKPTKTKNGGACGSSEEAISFGGLTYDAGEGYPSGVRASHKWNGSVWANTTNMPPSSRWDMGYGGSASEGISIGGNPRDGKCYKWRSVYEEQQHLVHGERVINVTLEEPYQRLVEEITQTITNNGQDFSLWTNTSNPYVSIVTDYLGRKIWGYIGSNQDNEETALIYKDKSLSEIGWNGDTDTFDFDRNDHTYAIKRSNVDLTSLFSAKPLKKGSDGSLLNSDGTLDSDIADQVLAQGFAGVIDADVLDTDKVYFNILFDAGYPTNIKSQIVNLAQTREDSISILDNGDNASVVQSLVSRTNNQTYNTYQAALYESYNKVYDIFTGKDVWFSPCYHMAYILPRNDNVSELWYAAAGFTRGVINTIKDLRFNPTSGQREQLYTQQLNPIVKFSQGYAIWSQLTTQSKSSALQNVNVVRLYLYIRAALIQYANNFIFEQNDQTTWNQVRTEVIHFLEEIKKRRGLYDYAVEVGSTVYEKTSKTFHVNITLQPIKTVEKIELNIFIR